MQEQLARELYDQSCEAIEEGRASELWECPEGHGLQGVRGRSIIKGTAFDFNASEHIQLRCGDWLI